MDRYVLFSPVGGHDPVANYHDGAILHICRVYRPEKVYLYLSREMVERSRMDDRYRASLRLLEREIGHHFQAIEQIEREDLTQVQLFDTFYAEFEGILRRLHAENPECKLLLNLSSGTPAMKSALDVLTVLSPIQNMKAIQVATPHERENPKDEDPQKYDVEFFWETNEDNAPEFQHRCWEVQSEQLLVKIKKESIQRLLDAYDYKAALLLAEDIRDSVSPRAMQMLKAAECRSQLDLSGYAKALKGLDVKFMPIEAGDQRKIFEYVLNLQIKLEQGSYADFLRGLTPVIADLFEIYLREHFEIGPEDFCRRTTSGAWKLNEAVMERTAKGRRVRDILVQKYASPVIKESYLGSDNILAIINGMATGAEMEDVAYLEQIRYVEEKVRNTAAHEIVSVTEDWIRRNTKMSPMEILKTLKRIMNYDGIHTKSEDWDSCLAMNRIIIQELNMQ